MKANALSRPDRIGLKVATVIFGAFGLLTALLSMAPGAPGPLWVLLRTASVIFIVAGWGIGAREAWAEIAQPGARDARVDSPPDPGHPPDAWRVRDHSIARRRRLVSLRVLRQDIRRPVCLGKHRKL
jgi:hypothetical protein